MSKLIGHIVRSEKNDVIQFGQVVEQKGDSLLLDTGKTVTAKDSVSLEILIRAVETEIKAVSRIKSSIEKKIQVPAFSFNVERLYDRNWIYTQSHIIDFIWDLGNVMTNLNTLIAKNNDPKTLLKEYEKWFGKTKSISFERYGLSDDQKPKTFRDFVKCLLQDQKVEPGENWRALRESKTEARQQT